MVLPTLGIVVAILDVATRIRGLNVLKNPTKLLKGMLVGLGSYLPEIIGHLYQAATIPHRERQNEDRTVADTAAAVQYEKQSREQNQMDRHEESETVDDNELGKTEEITSVLVRSTPRIVRKLRTGLQNFAI